MSKNEKIDKAISLLVKRYRANLDNGNSEACMLIMNAYFHIVDRHIQGTK